MVCVLRVGPLVQVGGFTRHDWTCRRAGSCRCWPKRGLPRGPLENVGRLGADRSLGELLQDVRQFGGDVDLLRAEHGVGKRHRSPQTRTKLEGGRGGGGEEGRLGQPGARGRRACQGVPGPGSQVPSLDPGRGQRSVGREGLGAGSRIRNQIGVPGLNWARPGSPCLPGFGVGRGRGLGVSGLEAGQGAGFPRRGGRRNALTAPPQAPLKMRANRPS